MSPHAIEEIAAGTVVEFFESKEVICGVCMASKSHRLTILTEHNREVNLAQSRLIHAGRQTLNLKLGRDELINKLAQITALRKALMKSINVEELWSLIEEESEGFGAKELAEFTFSEAVGDDHIAAIQRVLLQDRLFFQFKDNKFHARPREKVEQRREELEKEAQREARLENGSSWLNAVWNRKNRPSMDDQQALVESIKSFCLFGQESPEAAFVKELFKRANIPVLSQSAFRILVRLGIWHENENLYLHELGISPDFPEEVESLAGELSRADTLAHWSGTGRRDLRHLHAFTIDSALTRDYDDALSLRVLDGGFYEVGVHIADAAEFVAKGDPIDREAEVRVSSIYLPDGRITMLPAQLSEGLCSLKQDEDRFAFSFLLRMDAEGVLQDYEIVPSVVRIHEQITYQDVNERVPGDPYLTPLHELAVKLRRQRIARGAVILPIPEIQVYVNPAGMIQVSRYEKETPSQIMVSEWMIAANALAATYLVEHDIPAVFRSQAECKPETDFTQSEHEIFTIYRQRRLFARAELEPRSKPHCSLALPHYTTVTSPIRRYADLVVQRQLKHAILQGTALYGEEELKQLIMKLAAMQSKIFLVQRKWTRYWILKYIEQEDIHTLNAIILDRSDRYAHLLLPDFLMETNAQLSEGARFQAGEMVRVKIDRLNPRDDVLRVQMPDFPKS